MGTAHECMHRQCKAELAGTVPLVEEEVEVVEGEGEEEGRAMTACLVAQSSAP